jgi:hypothetical protein
VSRWRPLLSLGRALSSPAPRPPATLPPQSGSCHAHQKPFEKPSAHGPPPPHRQTSAHCHVVSPPIIRKLYIHLLQGSFPTNTVIPVHCQVTALHQITRGCPAQCLVDAPPTVRQLPCPLPSSCP